MSAGFRHLNLRWNPFGEPDQSERPALITGAVSEWVTYLQGPGVALQFLGDHGRGKSSRLLAIHRDGGFPYFRAGRQVVPIQPGVLLVDEVEELSPWRRWRIFQTSNSLALALCARSCFGLIVSTQCHWLPCKQRFRRNLEADRLGVERRVNLRQERPVAERWVP